MYSTYYFNGCISFSKLEGHLVEDGDQRTWHIKASMGHLELDPVPTKNILYYLE